MTGKVHPRLMFGLIMALLAAAGCAGAAPATPTSTPEPTATPPLTSETPIPATETPTPTEATPANVLGEVDSPAGILLVTGAEISDRWPPECTEGSNCYIAQEGSGSAVLIVWLARKGEGDPITVFDEISVLVITKAITVAAGDGTVIEVGGGGVYYDPTGLTQTGLIFIVQEDQDGFILNWLDNPPIPLGI